MMKINSRKNFQGKRRVKIPTQKNLENVALYYLSRFAASENSLRKTLKNRILRAAMRDETFKADLDTQKQLHTVIETIIEKHRKTGALNDAAFAEVKTTSLRRQGRSRRVIQQKLALKGIKKDLIEKALLEIDGDEDPEAAELKAAVAFARRKKLGPFRTRKKDEDTRQKDFAALARGGFSSSITRKVIGGNIPEDDAF